MSVGLKRGGETQRQIPSPQSFLYISLFYVSFNKGIFRQDYKTGVYLYLSTRRRPTLRAANGSANGAGRVGVFGSAYGNERHQRTGLIGDKTGLR
jgi:hypothetical protein